MREKSPWVLRLGSAAYQLWAHGEGHILSRNRLGPAPSPPSRGTRGAAAGRSENLGRMGRRVSLANNTHRRVFSLSGTFHLLSWLWRPQDLKHSQSAISMPLNSWSQFLHLASIWKWPPSPPTSSSHLSGIWPRLIQSQRVKGVSASQKEAIPILIQVHDLEV